MLEVIALWEVTSHHPRRKVARNELGHLFFDIVIEMLLLQTQNTAIFVYKFFCMPFSAYPEPYSLSNLRIGSIVVSKRLLRLSFISSTIFSPVSQAIAGVGGGRN